MDNNKSTKQSSDEKEKDEKVPPVTEKESTDDESLDDSSHHDKSDDEDESEKKQENRESVDDDDDEEDEDDSNDSSLWMDLKEGWRQHCLAILVAILATFIAFTYQQKQQVAKEILGSMKKSPVHALYDNDYGELEKHSYLTDYERTANVSFCGGDHFLTVNLPQGLAQMDFNLPKNLLDSMKMHYAADMLEDDEYEKVLKYLTGGSSSSKELFATLSKSHFELECLLRLEKESPQDYIKGLTFFYPSPNINTMYPEDARRQQELSVMKKSSGIHPSVLTFTGFAAKFINLTPKPVLLFWDGKGDLAPRRLIGEIPPFESLGTATTTPGQSFSVSPVHDRSHALDRWTITADDAVVYYEPDGIAEKLNHKDRALYDMQQLNKEFAKHYLIHSGRTWLANFPRAFPVHFMYEARQFGQVHTVELDCGEEAFTTKRITVESVTPRVFSIPNFLTFEECDGLIELAAHQGMNKSTVFAGANSAANFEQNMQRDHSTRSSSNTWLQRDAAQLTDQIYRRAAQLLKLDESLLQGRRIGDEFHNYHHSVAESLQVIRYQEGEKYSAHHDFVYPPQVHRHQPTRFATLLLYLNDNFEGGQTVFPRAVNSHYHQGVTVQPQKGKAVLFYSVLPDGNLDDLSQHESVEVTEGTKYLANLWVWEPVIN